MRLLAACLLVFVGGAHLADAFYPFVWRQIRNEDPNRPWWMP